MKLPWTKRKAPAPAPVTQTRSPEDWQREVEARLNARSDHLCRELAEGMRGRLAGTVTADVTAQFTRLLRDKGVALKQKDIDWLASEVGRRLATAIAYHLRQYHDGETAKFPTLGPGPIVPELRTMSPEQLAALVGVDGNYVVVEVREPNPAKKRKRTRA